MSATPLHLHKCVARFVSGSGVSCVTGNASGRLHWLTFVVLRSTDFVLCYEAVFHFWIL